MHNVRFDYTVYEFGEELERSYAYISISDNSLREISKRVREGKPMRRIADLPEKILQKFYDAANADFYNDVDVSSYGREIDIQNAIPDELLKLLPKDVQQKLGYDPAEHPDESAEQSEEVDSDSGEEVHVYFDENGKIDNPDWDVSEKGESLYLVIKQEFLDKIIEGKKEIEYREIKANTYKRYLELNEEGKPRLDFEMLDKLRRHDTEYLMSINACPYIPKDIRYLDLAAGYNKDRDTARVEVGGIGFEAGIGMDGNPCWIIKYYIKEVLEYHRGKYRLIKTKDDLFKIIDSKLTRTQKQDLLNADPATLHFGFGTWIRNEFIHPGDAPIDELYGNEVDTPFILDDPDSLSAQIIDDYLTHLKKIL